MRSLLPLAVAALVGGCTGSRDELLANLQSVRPEDRASAVRKLAGQAQPDDLVLFTRAAKDTSPLVRGEAAIALGASTDPRVVDVLGELLGDPDESVQAKSASALARIRTDQAKTYLTLQYARRGRSTRQAIVDALKAANVPGAMAMVVAAESQAIWDRNLHSLTSGSLPEQVAAAEMIGKSGRVEAVNRLLPLTRDSQVVLAAAAVRGLGHTGDARAVEPIAALLAENDPDLRQAAIEALIRLGDPKALPRLREVALEKSATSALATQAIVSLPQSPETSAALCQIALDAAPDDALAAGRAMRTRGGCPLEPILDKLGRRGGDPTAALHALQGLGKTASRATPLVIPLIASKDAGVVVEALTTAAELGDASAAAPVLGAYEQEKNRVAQLRADWISRPLPQSFAPGYDPAHQALAADPADRDAELRAKQADLLARVRAANEVRLRAAGKPSAIRPPVPHEIVDDASEDRLRALAAALAALGQLKVDGAQDRIASHLDDPSPAVRQSAYVGLVALGPAGIARAADGLLDPSRDVQSAVAAALAEAGPEGQRRIADLLPRLAADRLPLLSALERAGPAPILAPALLVILREGGVESALAAHLLGKLGAKEAVDPLLRQLDDPASVGRREALAALGRIGDRRAAEAVARDLNHDSPDVRLAAVEALGQLGVSPRPDALDALKGDYDRRVREAAAAAVSKLAATGEVHAEK